MTRKGPAARELAERFWEKVEKREGDGCWIWIAGQNGSGGVVNLGKPLRFSTRNAHRVAWFLTFGAWPAGSLWRCRKNLMCVRPGHCRLEMPPEVLKMRQAMTRIPPRKKVPAPPPAMSRVDMIRALARKKGQ